MIVCKATLRMFVHYPSGIQNEIEQCKTYSLLAQSINFRRLPSSAVLCLTAKTNVIDKISRILADISR